MYDVESFQQRGDIMKMNFKRKLPVPLDVKTSFPVSEQMATVKAKRDEEINSVFEGKSEKFILVIGPCSADLREPVLEYISRLRKVADDVKDKLIIIPRIYTNKPRTSGQGYMGMLHQPDPDEKPDIFKGIVALRDLHMTALRDYGFSCADEMLYPENHRYLSDLLSYVSVGARSVENQQHRLTASGVGIPVGMKNPTSGDFSVMFNSVVAAQAAHNFIYRGWDVNTSGNPYAHTILRGSVNKYGRSRPNYHYEDLMKLYQMYGEKDLKNPATIVDANHSNSDKQYKEQIRIVKEVLHSRSHSKDIHNLVKGVMIESYLVEGTQKIGCQPHVYGQSITDPCLGWEDSENLLYEIAERC